MCVLQERPSILIPPAPVAAQVLSFVPDSLAELDLGTTALVTGCEGGAEVLELARRFPRSLFAGLDPSTGAIDRARRQAVREGLGNVWFEPGDVTTQRFGGIFHHILALDSVPPAVPVLSLLSALHRSLRRRGTLFFRPAAGMVSHRLLEAGFARVHTVALPGDPARPILVARR